ncbi:MAG: hypothetical protein KDE09_14950 [Anaerolineales bacterium]|nr:hypothetical protein [Anaerolineales bacterium]
MSQREFSPVQEAVLAVVQQYPGHFSRSGLAKMLVGARSWQDTGYPEYGRFASYGRKDITYQIDILLQQGFLELDSHEHLTAPLGRGEAAV